MIPTPSRGQVCCKDLISNRDLQGYDSAWSGQRFCCVHGQPLRSGENFVTSTPNWQVGNKVPRCMLPDQGGNMTLTPTSVNGTPLPSLFPETRQGQRLPSMKYTCMDGRSCCVHGVGLAPGAIAGMYASSGQEVGMLEHLYPLTTTWMNGRTFLPQENDELIRKVYPPIPKSMTGPTFIPRREDFEAKEIVQRLLSQPPCMPGQSLTQSGQDSGIQSLFSSTATKNCGEKCCLHGKDSPTAKAKWMVGQNSYQTGIAKGQSLSSQKAYTPRPQHLGGLAKQQSYTPSFNWSGRQANTQPTQSQFGFSKQPSYTPSSKWVGGQSYTPRNAAAETFNKPSSYTPSSKWMGGRIQTTGVPGASQSYTPSTNIVRNQGSTQQPSNFKSEQTFTLRSPDGGSSGKSGPGTLTLSIRWE